MSDVSGISRQSRVLAIPGLALAIYALLMAAGLATILSTCANLASRGAEVAATEKQLQRLRGSAGGDRSPAAELYGLEPGEAFLNGDKLTVAAAELQRRVAASVVAAGGAVLSSQIDRGQAKGQTADLELAAECDIDQAGFQRLLYDLESTTPFLFIDKMNVRTRNDTQDKEAEPRLSVALRLSAVWRNPEP